MEENYIKTGYLLRVDQLLLVVGTFITFPLFVISKNYWFTGVITVLFFVLVGFLQKGFELRKNNRFYKGVWIFKFLIWKKEISLNTFNKVTLLKSKKSSTDEDTGSKSYFTRYEVALLNEKHTKKEIILNESEEEDTADLLEFLTNNVGLEREVYSPDFS